jgi:hypothetical protein
MKHKAPGDLQVAGRQLWASLHEQFAIPEGSTSLLVELCQISDSLAAVRDILRRDGPLPEGKKHPLVDAEPKLSAQFQKLWKMLGFADPEEPRRGPGRPLRS